MPPFLAVVADPHVGNHAAHGGPMVDGLNRRGRETLQVLRRALDIAAARGCKTFAVAGDLFHSRRPEPAVLRGVMDLFAGTPMNVLLVPGNHDMLDASCEGGNTAMSPLHLVAQVFHRPTIWAIDGGAGVFAVPFEGGKPMADHLEEALKNVVLARTPTILVSHVGLWSVGSATWERGARDGMEAQRLLRAMTAADIDLAFVGNYHNPAIFEALGNQGAGAVQVGTLCPATHGDAGLVRRGQVAFAEVDGTVTFEEVPGPRFVTLPWEEGEDEGTTKGCSLYVRWRGPDKAPVPYGDIVAVDVVSEEAEPVGHAEAPPELPDEVLIREHVEAMVAPDGVDRGRVADLALDLWRRAG